MSQDSREGWSIEVIASPAADKGWTAEVLIVQGTERKHVPDLGTTFPTRRAAEQAGLDVAKIWIRRRADAVPRPVRLPGGPVLDLTNDPNEPLGDRHCAGCGKVIPARQTTLLRDGETFHFRCWAAWLRLEAMSQEERSRIATARAQGLVTVACRLVDQVREEIRRRRAGSP